MALDVAAGWVAQSFIKTLVHKAVEIAGSQIAQYLGMDDNIRSLRNSLLKVQFVLALAEEKQTKELFSMKELHRLLQLLMKELKFVAYEAEDLLDEISYDILKQKIESEERKEGQSAGNPTIISVANYFKKLFSSDTTKEAADIQSRLDKLADELKELILLLPMDNEKKKRKFSETPIRETSSFSSETQLIGRQEDVEKVVNLLIDGVGTSNDNFSVLSLYGIGGVGKTTLVQFVYNDKRVHDYFDLKIWVCISDCLDERRITKEIIQCITKREQLEISLDFLQSTLKANITSKKLLFVLDDMWEEDGYRWKKLCLPLMYAAPGTKILLTTQLETVVKNVGSRDKIHLKGLESDDFFQLFEKYAFESSNFEQNPDFEPIGRKIVDKLKGLPLAAKTVGSMLRSNLSEEHWETIMKCKLWELPQKEGDVLPALRLSYEYLPAHLKQCFSYCSLFPKDCNFRKDKLVYMWMAQGFIFPRSDLRIEDVGRGYIDDLMSRCFFEKDLSSDSVIKMHDLIHDLAESVSYGENLRMDNCMLESTERFINFSVNTDYLDQNCLFNICGKHTKLWTILCSYTWFNGTLHLDNMLSSLRSIRMLNLASCGVKELPDNIGNLKHLRYLNISYNNIVRLPETICSLYNLQYLNILKLPLISLPKEMCNLINLRRLESSSDFLCKINKVGNMTSLQELHEFRVSCEKGHRILELKNLKQLHGALHLKGLENVKNKEEASEAKLNEKVFLYKLTLEWDVQHISWDSNVDVIEGLQPHSNIKSLCIIDYGCSYFPSWLDKLVLSRLEELTLQRCSNWERTDWIRKLPNLKVLRLGKMKSVKTFSHGLSCEFAKLEQLCFETMEELEQWTIPEGRKSFSCLRVLTIENCRKLKEIPLLEEFELNSLEKVKVLNCPNLMPISQNKNCVTLPPSITKLNLTNCDGYLENVLEGCLHKLTSLTRLKINGHQHESTESSEAQVGLSLPPSVMKLGLCCSSSDDCCASKIRPLCNPQFLSKLMIKGCSGIYTISIDFLQNFTQLSELVIISCNELRSIDFPHNFSGLCKLWIRSCSSLGSIEGLQVVTFLKELRIDGCPKLMESMTQVEQQQRGSPSSPLQLENLCIDNSLLLKFAPLKIQNLLIYSSDEVVMFTAPIGNIYKSLQYLELEQCVNVKSLSTDLQFPSLKDLWLINCPKLESLPAGMLPTCLEFASLRDCHPLLEEQLNKFKEEKLKKAQPFRLDCR